MCNSQIILFIVLVVLAFMFMQQCSQPRTVTGAGEPPDADLDLTEMFSEI